MNVPTTHAIGFTHALSVLDGIHLAFEAFTITTQFCGLKLIQWGTMAVTVVRVPSYHCQQIKTSGIQVHLLPSQYFAVLITSVTLRSWTLRMTMVIKSWTHS